MRHVILLGDSIFDNGFYTGGGPDTAASLRELLGPEDRVTLAAVDGARTDQIQAQLAELPADATHLAVSVGGNDALGFLNIIQDPADSVLGVGLRLHGMRAAFADRYQEMLEVALARELPLILCTIYEPRFDAKGMERVELPSGDLQAAGAGLNQAGVLQRFSTALLPVFNDAILAAAARAGLPTADLRTACNEDADFANAIEPSSQGSRKIAALLARIIAEHDFARRICALYC